MRRLAMVQLAMVHLAMANLAPFARPKLGENKVVFRASHDRRKPAALSEKACSIHFAHPQDRATPGSEPSAEAAGNY